MDEHEQARCSTGFFLVSVESIDSRREGEVGRGKGRMGGLIRGRFFRLGAFFYFQRVTA